MKPYTPPPHPPFPLHIANTWEPVKSFFGPKNLEEGPDRIPPTPEARLGFVVDRAAPLASERCLSHGARGRWRERALGSNPQVSRPSRSSQACGKIPYDRSASAASLVGRVLHRLDELRAERERQPEVADHRPGLVILARPG